MLKKLVKYGNSNALILDRAILELLNIEEGAMLKLHTDGKSLIITPEKQAPTSDISLSGVEAMHEYAASFKKNAEAIIAKEENAAWAPGTENHAKLQKVTHKIMEKYRDVFTGYDHQALLEEVDAFGEAYQGNKSSPEFIEAVKAIQAKYSPRLAAMHKEMAEAAKALGCPEIFINPIKK